MVFQGGDPWAKWPNRKDFIAIGAQFRAIWGCLSARVRDGFVIGQSAIFLV